MKELLALLLLGGGAYYAFRQPRRSTTPAPPTSVRVTPQPPRGKGPWSQKEGECSATGCYVGWENTRLRKTGWAESQMTKEAYDKMPQRVASLAALKKRKGVLSVKRID